MKNALYFLVIFLSLSGTTGCNFCYDRSCGKLYGNKSEKNNAEITSEFFKKKAVFVSTKQINNPGKTVFPLISSVKANDFENISPSYIFLAADENKNRIANKYISSAVFETNFNVELLRQSFEKDIEPDTPAYDGIYSFNDKKYVGMVEFNGIEANGNIDFIISIGSSKGCTSSLKGKAKLIKADKATYKDSLSGCSLDFVFNAKKLQIKENKCRLFHGATCEFRGTFDKE